MTRSFAPGLFGCSGPLFQDYGVVTDLSANPYAALFSHLGSAGYIKDAYAREGDVEFDVQIGKIASSFMATHAASEVWSDSAQAYVWEFIVGRSYRQRLMNEFDVGSEEAVVDLLGDALSAWLMKDKPASKHVAVILSHRLR